MTQDPSDAKAWSNLAQARLNLQEYVCPAHCFPAFPLSPLQDTVDDGTLTTDTPKPSQQPRGHTNSTPRMPSRCTA